MQTKAMLVFHLALGIILLLCSRQFHVKLLPFSSNLLLQYGRRHIVMPRWCSGAPKTTGVCRFCALHKAQTRCSLVQACTTVPRTDWSWILAEAQCSPSRIGLSVLDLLWSHWPWSHRNEFSQHRGRERQAFLEHLSAWERLTNLPL